MKWDVNIAAENLTGKLAMIKWQVPAMLIANQIWWFQAWMVQTLFYQCRLFSFQASNASSLREEEEEFFSIKLKNVWLFQSCLSKLNTIALGVGSQFSSVKLRESKEEQQQAARTYTQGPTGFHEFFFTFLHKFLHLLVWNFARDTFFYSLTLMPSLAFFQSRRFNNLAEKVDEKMGVESLRATLCRSRRSPAHNWVEKIYEGASFVKN